MRFIFKLGIEYQFIERVLFNNCNVNKKNLYLQRIVSKSIANVTEVLVPDNVNKQEISTLEIYGN